MVWYIKRCVAVGPIGLKTVRFRIQIISCFASQTVPWGICLCEWIRCAWSDMRGAIKIPSRNFTSTAFFEQCKRMSNWQIWVYLMQIACWNSNRSRMANNKQLSSTLINNVRLMQKSGVGGARFNIVRLKLLIRKYVNTNRWKGLEKSVCFVSENSNKSFGIYGRCRREEILIGAASSHFTASLSSIKVKTYRDSFADSLVAAHRNFRFQRNSSRGN